MAATYWSSLSGSANRRVRRRAASLRRFASSLKRTKKPSSRGMRRTGCRRRWPRPRGVLGFAAARASLRNRDKDSRAPVRVSQRDSSYDRSDDVALRPRRPCATGWRSATRAAPAAARCGRDAPVLANPSTPSHPDTRASERVAPREKKYSQLRSQLSRGLVVGELVHLPVHSFGIDELSGQGHCGPPGESADWLVHSACPSAESSRRPSDAMQCAGNARWRDCYSGLLPNRDMTALDARPLPTATSLVYGTRARPCLTRRADVASQYTPAPADFASLVRHAPEAHRSCMHVRRRQQLAHRQRTTPEALRHCHAARGPNARCTVRDHAKCRGAVANTAGRLDAHRVADDESHERHRLGTRATGSVETGAGFHVAAHPPRARARSP